MARYEEGGVSCIKVQRPLHQAFTVIHVSVNVKEATRVTLMCSDVKHTHHLAVRIVHIWRLATVITPRACSRAVKYCTSLRARGLGF